MRARRYRRGVFIGRFTRALSTPRRARTAGKAVFVFHGVDITAEGRFRERVWDKADTGWHGEASGPDWGPDPAPNDHKGPRIVPAFAAKIGPRQSFLWYLWRIWFILLR